MIAFYCIKLNILKSYAILSCFRITKMENDPISIIHDNPFFLFLCLRNVVVVILITFQYSMSN